MDRIEDKENNTIAITAGIVGSVLFLVLLVIVVIAVVVRSFRQKRYRVGIAADREL